MAKVRIFASALALTSPLVLVAATGAQASTVSSSASSSAAVPAKPAGAVSAAAVTKSLKLVTQEQSKNYYCGPAAGRAVVSSFLPKKSLPSQKTMAGYMHTKPPGGTGANWVAIGINKAIHLGSYYQNLHPTSSGFVWNAVTYDVGTKKHPLVARVLVGAKPWSHSSNKDGHFMVIYGYHSDSKGKQLYWWDPADNTFHHSSLSSSWTAISKGNKNLLGFYPS
ncbi:C39 family peptidase [Actinoallomurus sp. CA-150999]|uniref:C39 family peptidase n=1 Tax=Actinoallomurus sp. CA-150999 TaxID=3239887 RepID=UPI003D942FCF